MTARAICPVVALVLSMAFGTPVAARAVDSSRTIADCQETAVSPKPPNAWMGGLSKHWLRQGSLWMGYTRAEEAFVARPNGQKIAWFRGSGSTWGRLRVSGTRIDAVAPPLKVEIPAKYPFRQGFQSSVLTFSEPGCWQVVARVGLTARFVFVMRVESE